MITHLSTHNRLAELQVGPGAMTSKTRVIGKEVLVFLTTNEKVTIRARNARSSLLSQGFFADTNISLDGDASLCYGPHPTTHPGMYARHNWKSGPVRSPRMVGNRQR